MRWTRSLRLVALVLTMVLATSGVASIVWAQAAGPAAPAQTVVEPPPPAGPAAPTGAVAQQPALGTIVVVKDALPDDPQVFVFTRSWGLSFNLDDDGSITNTHSNTLSSNLPPGTYVVGEISPTTGWIVSSVCTTPGNAGTPGSSVTFGTHATINLAAGVTVTCTFTNRKDVPAVGTIIVVKDAVPDDSQDFTFTGSWSSVPFLLDDDTTTTNSALLNTQSFALPAGTYTVTETVPLGWNVASSVCTTPGNAAAPGSSATFGSVATINLVAGATVTCTFTNRKADEKAGTIIIVKDAGPDDPQDFLFNWSGSFFVLDDDGSLSVPSALPNTQTYTLPAATYAVSEIPVSGWTLASATCTDGSPVSAIILSPGEAVTCTFTNRKLDEKGGTIIIVKDAVPDDSQDFTFTGSGGLGTFSLDDDTTTTNSTLANTQTFTNLTPGTYTVAETVPLGWNVASSVCTTPATAAAPGSSTTFGSVATINLVAGATVTCTFTNRKAEVPPTMTYVYSVKIVCGTVRPPRPKPEIPTLRDPAPVVPGLYRTAVNIHNFWEESTAFQHKVAIALPLDQPRGPVTKLLDEKLGPNEALEVDCHNIVALLGGTTSATAEFLKGFLVIESPVELEITAVYTAEELMEQGISIDVERIQPHVMRK